MLAEIDVDQDVQHITASHRRLTERLDQQDVVGYGGDLRQAREGDDPRYRSQRSGGGDKDVAYACRDKSLRFAHRLSADADSPLLDLQFRQRRTLVHLAVGAKADARRVASHLHGGEVRHQDVAQKHESRGRGRLQAGEICGHDHHSIGNGGGASRDGIPCRLRIPLRVNLAETLLGVVSAKHTETRRVKIEILAPQDLTNADVAAWTRLQGDDALASPFLSPKWVQTLARCGGPDRKQLKIARLRDDGEAVGFMPARVARLTALPPGAPLCDYQGLVAEPRLRFDPREVVQAFGVARFDFDKLLADQAVFRSFARGGSCSQVIDLREGYDAYEADRRAAGTDILKDCAKKRRRLEREHGDVAFTAASASHADFDQLIAWKRAQYATTGQTDIFDAGWPLDVLKALFDSEDAEYRATLFTLHVGGKLIAGHLALCTPKIAHAWFIAHDDDFGRYSPGVILITEVIRWAAARGMAELDLGPGDYRFKLSLANRTRDVSHGFVGRPSASAFARGATYRLREMVEAMPLGAASAFPGKAMRRLDLMRSL
jgi:CelD/BcsL family acetyltransferase involved in cellulose biosynthesis